jgi:hypothetical protein
MVRAKRTLARKTRQTSKEGITLVTLKGITLERNKLGRNTWEGTLGEGNALEGTLGKGTLWKPIHPVEKISATIEEGSGGDCGVVVSLLFQS